MVTGDCEFEYRPGIILQHDFPTFNIFTHSNLQRQRLENSKNFNLLKYTLMFAVDNTYFKYNFHRKENP